MLFVEKGTTPIYELSFNHSPACTSPFLSIYLSFYYFPFSFPNQTVLSSLLSPASTLTPRPHYLFYPMAALSKVSLLALIALIFALSSVAAQEAPAPSPASPATSIAPSAVSACLAAFLALAFGSTLRI
ncbi:hypothetical protein Csa_018595 [Cucumis sativus]|uniref:Uncharacterized protein n=1 Tax=Cucumis sativus TaxID=3659 RepID=A0A0A0LKU1_CUCSA|nr:hypothetical protein Csa_018595 [Cucumis sativus]